jgi:hypothetical protein
VLVAAALLIFAALADAQPPAPRPEPAPDAFSLAALGLKDRRPS